MADFEKEHVGESSMCQKGLERERQCHSLTVAQSHQLEAFFNECSHPNENQQNQLGRKIGLDPKQIMIWYQNKMTQTENERILNIIPSILERSSVMGSNFAPKKSTPGSPSNSSNESLLRQNICGSLNAYHPTFHQNNNTNVREHTINTNNIPIISSSLQENYGFHHDNRDKPSIFEIGVAAMNEMVELLKLNNPIWIESPCYEGCFIHREVHDKLFPNQYRPSKSPTTRFESSKVCGIVPMNAIELIQNFLDPIKWMNMFPTIVTKARTIEVLDSGNMGGSIQLMYEKLHILSPLLEARDYFFIRYCRKLDQTTWIMVDVSYDLIKEIQSGEPSHAWKFPSGCAIRDMDNGESMVTWIEHVQVDEKMQVHHIFRNLLIGYETYGAKRWIITLQRMSERYNVEVGATCFTRDDLKGVVNDPEGLDNVMQISLRMVKRFCEILSMTGNLVYPTSSQLNSEDRISIRKNEEFTQKKGFIVTASTSIWLPHSFQTVFNFLKDDNTRCQWDVLTVGNNVTELARINTGSIPGNNITIIQPYVSKENNILVLQESGIDEIGAFLIYAPIDAPTVNLIINGGDAKKVTTLPSGFIISPYGHYSLGRDNNGNAQNGSILTIAFQILIIGHPNDNSISQKEQKSAVTSVHTLLSSTVLKIKTILDCSD
ncbi:hypothetical protein KY290_021050 [Solanum tuberosum]|uniref:Uncharacterized protein n=3 Tax=Solanum tuberosum TaxID=4113 RepID=A0ABQ7V0F2_SOLTU|nr:hypothetical protein KY284_022259 [Solanum tuberosum]KAH0682482.1 hypothetical protein KY289_020234 [Solanum tuberosum]KAH0695069.1 hypothetical protein KY285_022166 [Solanum tuberosum]KAH0757557.1 hypothetical protein KY290_021050 [Solanum tuberosum]